MDKPSNKNDISNALAAGFDAGVYTFSPWFS
jgi:hypothetical protein